MEQRSDIEIKIQKGRIRDLSAGKKFAILRTSKIKSMGNIAASLSHTFRERPTPNADLERTPRNTILVGPDTADAVVEAWGSAAPVKQRKNAVLAVEYLVTGSPEAMKELSADEQDQYFKDALSWLQEKHGVDNILSAVIHRDETTPHLTAMVIPLVDGKLNAKHFFGGRGKLSVMQTDFAQNVGAEYGLERGVERSGATHQRVSHHYAAIQEGPRDAVSLPERQKGNILGVGKETDGEWLVRAEDHASQQVWTQRMVAREAHEKTQVADQRAKHETSLAEAAYKKMGKLELALGSVRGALQGAEQTSADQKSALEAKDQRIAFLTKAMNEAGVVQDVNRVINGWNEDEKQQAVARREQSQQEQVYTDALIQMKPTVNMIRNYSTAVFDSKADELNYLQTFKATFGEQGIERIANGDLSALKDLAAKERDQRTIAHVTLRLFKRNPEFGLDQSTIERGMSLHDPKGHEQDGHSI